MPEDHPNPPISVSDIDRAPDAVEVQTAKTPEDRIQDLLDRLGVISDENQSLKDENRELKRQAHTIETLDDLIKPYASKAFRYMCTYSGVVGILLVLHGFRVACFKLEESVLNFLVGSTAVTVIGLVGMVLTGIFVGARAR